MNQAQIIYNTLLEAYGPQGWWPIVNDTTLLCEYHVNAPKNELEALEICFGSILTQGVQWHPNVVKAIQQLKKRDLIDIKKIISIKSDKLAQMIKPSGYYNQKAKKLKNFCNFIFDKYEGKLKKLLGNDVSKLREELLSVDGIGPETADSIILYTAKKPIFVIDAYTRRIFNRNGFRENSYEELQNRLMENLPNSEKLFNEYHALLVELGKNICKNSPLCGRCPLNDICAYSLNNQK